MNSGRIALMCLLGTNELGSRVAWNVKNVFPASLVPHQIRSTPPSRLARTLAREKCPNKREAKTKSPPFTGRTLTFLAVGLHFFPGFSRKTTGSVAGVVAVAGVTAGVSVVKPCSVAVDVTVAVAVTLFSKVIPFFFQNHSTRCNV